MIGVTSVMIASADCSRSRDHGRQSTPSTKVSPRSLSSLLLVARKKLAWSASPTTSYIGGPSPGTVDGAITIKIDRQRKRHIDDGVGGQPP